MHQLQFFLPAGKKRAPPRLQGEILQQPLAAKRNSRDTADPDNSNNLATATTTVTSRADLSLQNTDSPDPVLAGRILTYALKVVNNGPSAAAGITVEDVTLAYPNWPLRERQVRANILRTCDEAAVAETHDGFESEDFFPDFARLGPPAVLVRGGESPMVPTQAADELKRTNPAIPTEVVPGAGHMVMWDNPSGFWSAVSPHLDAAMSSKTTASRR